MSHILDQFHGQLRDLKHVIEIGCHHLEDTTVMRALWPGAHIIAFDPDPRNIEVIKRRKIDLELSVCFVPYAVGGKDEMADFYLSTNLTGDADHEWSSSSSLKRPRNFGTSENLQMSPCIFSPTPTRVIVVTLDSYLTGDSPHEIDLLWIDAQGGEADILRGATATLKRTRYLFMEHSTGGLYEGASNLNDLLPLLPDWEVVKVLPYDVFLKNKLL